MKIKNLIYKISFTAIIAALVFVATVFISIPYAGGAGYFNLSDGLIIFSTIYFGPIVGIFGGIIGTSLGDLYAGYANCIPFTILAKGLEGLVCFLLYSFLKDKKYLNYLAFIIPPIFMVASYIPYYLIYDDGQGVLALISSCYDLIQGLSGIIVAISLYTVFKKITLPSDFKKEELHLKLKTKTTK